MWGRFLNTETFIWTRRRWISQVSLGTSLRNPQTVAGTVLFLTKRLRQGYSRDGFVLSLIQPASSHQHERRSRTRGSPQIRIGRANPSEIRSSRTVWGVKITPLPPPSRAASARPPVSIGLVAASRLYVSGSWCIVSVWDDMLMVAGAWCRCAIRIWNRQFCRRFC